MLHNVFSFQVYCINSCFLFHVSPIVMIGDDNLSYSVTPRAKKHKIGEEIKI
jgi:hypothetical protein